MKANELRIGNWVEYTGGWLYGTRQPIGQWEEQDWYFMQEYQESTLEELKPIPLTPEILEKAGFVETNLYKWPTYNKGNITIVSISSSFSMYYGENGIVNLNSLHQLQNLYFALTGEELNIEL